jgi:hypothetical protein
MAGLSLIAVIDGCLEQIRAHGAMHPDVEDALRRIDAACCGFRVPCMLETLDLEPEGSPDEVAVPPAAPLVARAAALPGHHPHATGWLDSPPDAAAAPLASHSARWLALEEARLLSPAVQQ